VKKEKLSPEATQLRARAETRLKQQQAKKKPPADKTLADSQRLLHELQVHQIELEMQNAELMKSRNEMEVLLDKYTDLYDFAPIGYFSLTRQGRIQEVNLTGATLLGTERALLMNRPLASFVAVSSRNLFLAFLKTLLTASEKKVCELKLQKSDGSLFWAHLHGGSETDQADTSAVCRIAVSDITSLKLAQEAHHRLEILTAINLELKAEILKREAIQKNLKKSEHRKSELLDESRRLHGQLRNFSHRIIETREEERKLISRDLHDEITQLLASINVNLETLTRDATISPRSLRPKIIRTQHVVERAMKSIHDFAHKLRPTSLDDFGLIVTLHAYLNDFLKRTGIRVRFASFADVEKLSNTQRTTLYRIVLEALINIDKHAMAKHVNVSIRKMDAFVQLEVSDDGKSFDVARLQAQKGNKRLGLIGMREQAEMVGGRLTIQSTPGQGTTLIVRMPFKLKKTGSPHASSTILGSLTS
jgi:PAS domain S-box-containing protein